MTITEVLDYAKKQPDHTKVKFKFTNLLEEEKQCQVLDAWFRIFTIEGDKGFITEDQWKEVTGDIFSFEIIEVD
jgi:hypothetical protein